MKLTYVSVLVSIICYLPVRAADYVPHCFTPEIEVLAPLPADSTIVMIELTIEHAGAFILKTPEGQRADRILAWRTETAQVLSLEYRDGVPSLKHLTGNLQLLQEIRNVEESNDDEIPCRLIATGYVGVRLSNGRWSSEKYPIRVVSFIRMQDFAGRE